MGKKSSGRQETLFGVVAPSAWDEEDCVTGVSLWATDEGEYRIENSNKFIDLVHMSIQATGLVRRNKKDFKSINIKKYTLIESYSESSTV